MKRRITLILSAILVPLDAFALFYGFIIAYQARLHTVGISFYHLKVGNIPDVTDFNKFLLKGVLLLLVIGFTTGAYQIKDKLSLIKELKNLGSLFSLWSVFILAYFFIKHALFFSRYVLVAGSVISFSLSFFIRIITILTQNYLIKKGYLQQRLLVIGHTRHLPQIQTALLKSKLFQVQLFPRVENQTSDEQRLDHLSDYLTSHHIDQVFQISKSTLTSNQIMQLCHVLRIDYSYLPPIVTHHPKNITISSIANFPILHLRRTKLSGWGCIIKRLLDITLASIALVLSSPVFFIISILIKLDSKGPVFYHQERINQGKNFTIYKFRTMIQDADQLKQQLLAQNERQDGPLFKISNDPRITRLGKILRNTSLDELPQLWNILKGDMSLVGPRPHLPQEVDQYRKQHMKLLHIKPGLTGAAQVSGRSNLSFHDEFRLDKEYIDNWSILTDIKIILKTFFVLVNKAGKY